MNQQLYVLGHPVAHSKSPAMHNAAYRELGLPWEYGLADCEAESQAQAFLARTDWLGLNITMPYKPLAFQKATWASAAAKVVQGANVLVRRGDELMADNTDGAGCVAYLRQCGVDFAGARTVVCGTGPTSLAIAHAMAVSGANRVDVLGRSEAKAQQVIADYLQRCETAQSGAAQVCASSYGQAAQAIQTADVIVDATPLGMKPNDPAPFDTSLLAPHTVVFDVVYGHGQTALMAAAQAAGCAAYDGAGMLVAQAVLTVRNLVDWLDVPVSLDENRLFNVMAQAAGFHEIAHV